MLEAHILSLWSQSQSVYEMLGSHRNICITYKLDCCSDAKLDAFEKALAPIHSNVHAAISVNLSLARLAVQANQPDVATRRFVDVLRAAWWCWEAYEGLCNLGRGSLCPSRIPLVV